MASMSKQPTPAMMAWYRAKKFRVPRAPFEYPTSFSDGPVETLVMTEDDAGTAPSRSS